MSQLKVLIYQQYRIQYTIIFLKQQSFVKPNKMSTSITSSTLGKKTYKIIFLGDSGTGKTSIIERFVNNQFEEKENPTIGIDFTGKNINYKGTTCRLQLWDTAGQQRFRSLIPSYLKDAICAIFVFDVNNPETLANIPQWIDLFRDNRGDRAMSILCGNKSDLENAFDKSKLEAIMQKHKLTFHTISAKSGQNIDNLFFNVVDMINESQMIRHKKFKISNQDDETHNPPLTDKPLRAHEVTQQDNKEEVTQKLKLDKKNRRFLCC